MPLHFRDLFAAAAAGGRALVCGYRGARFLAPEDKLPAVLRAHPTGTDFRELDFVLTADVQIIVIHEDALTRTANAAQVFPDRTPRAVHELLLADICSSTSDRGLSIRTLTTSFPQRMPLVEGNG